MAQKKFTRRRWRRPERLTLEHPPVVRRKDISVPEPITLEPDIARHDNRRRAIVLAAAFIVFAGAEAFLIFAFFDWLPAVVCLIPLALSLAALRFRDGWIRHALRARSLHNPEVDRLVASLARSAAISAPEVFVLDRAVPNTISLGFDRPWIALTSSTPDLEELTLEGLLAHEIVHIRDGDAALATYYVLATGLPDLALRGVGTPAGLLLWLSFPFWPVAFFLRYLRAFWIGPDREHRADVAAALLTRYPPGVEAALRAAEGAHPPGVAMTTPFWFAPDDAKRADLIAEM